MQRRHEFFAPSTSHAICYLVAVEAVNIHVRSRTCMSNSYQIPCSFKILSSEPSRMVYKRQIDSKIFNCIARQIIYPLFNPWRGVPWFVEWVKFSLWFHLNQQSSLDFPFQAAWITLTGINIWNTSPSPALLTSFSFILMVPNCGHTVCRAFLAVTQLYNMIWADHVLITLRHILMVTDWVVRWLTVNKMHRDYKWYFNQ